MSGEPSLRGEAARLEELRLSATEHRITAEIAAGGHSTDVSELEALTARYPLRERMWASLMLALYRSGRQAEALSTYERARQSWWEPLERPRVELVTRQNQLVGFPIGSPDGTRIAFTVSSENADRPVTYVMDQAGGDLVEVREEAVALSWTPDGKRIVLSAYGSLVAARPDGTGDRGILRYPPDNGRLVMDWSPDGRWIVMTSAYGSATQQQLGDGTATNVYLMRSGGDELFLVGSGSVPSWRPASD
ncbi:MAG: BTAD domain-containing putative transcriptional regulator [Actinomycetota bacterium]